MCHEAGEGEEEEAEGKRRNFSGEFVFFSRSEKMYSPRGSSILSDKVRFE